MIAMLLCLALIVGNGNIVKAEEVLYETYTIPVNKKGNVCRLLTLDKDGWHYHGNFYDVEEASDVR